MIRVIAIDDHFWIRKALTDEINRQDDMRMVATGDQGSKTFNLIREHNPDVLILDLHMSMDKLFDPIATVKAVLQQHPKLGILILTGDDSAGYIHSLTAAGVMGYMLKQEDFSQELTKAMRCIMTGKRFYSPAVVSILLAEPAIGGEPKLTEHELQALRLAAQGLSNQQIADAFYLTEGRVKNLMTETYTKLGLQQSVRGENRRVSAVKRAHELGLI